MGDGFVVGFGSLSGAAAGFDEVCTEDDRVRLIVSIAEDSEIDDNPNPEGPVPDSGYNGSV